MRKPLCCRWVLYILHGQGWHFHFLILFLNNSQVYSDFMLSGIKFHICGPLSGPNFTAFLVQVESSLNFWRLPMFCLEMKISFIRQAILKFAISVSIKNSRVFLMNIFAIAFCQNTIKRFLMIVVDQPQRTFMNFI